MEYNFSNVLLILLVKYFFTIGYDLQLLLTKVVGATFPDTVHCVPKNGATKAKLMVVTSLNLNRFSKFFYHWKEKEISNKIHVSFPTTP